MFLFPSKDEYLSARKENEYSRILDRDGVCPIRLSGQTVLKFVAGAFLSVAEGEKLARVSGLCLSGGTSFFVRRVICLSLFE